MRANLITEIGIAAGDIWHFLDEQGEVTLDKLVRGIGKPKDLLLMSLGWLAREGHVVVSEDNSTYRAALTEKV